MKYQYCKRTLIRQTVLALFIETYDRLLKDFMISVNFLKNILGVLDKTRPEYFV